MSDQLFDILLNKYLNNDITESELTQFLTLLENCEDSFLDTRLEGLKDFIPNVKIGSERKEEIFELITTPKDLKNSTHNKFIYFKVASIIAAASLLICFLFIHYYSSSSQDVKISSIQSSDILLEDNNQVLISRHNKSKSISLVDSSQSILFGNVTIGFGKNGDITYTIAEDNVEDNSPITLETPRGKSAYIKLHDGSQVWLNAMSKLTFNPNFTKNKRNLILAGEGYFEVVTDRSRPFIVNTPYSQISVLGTGFNISAYKEDHEEATTLVHGKVSVRSGTNEEIIKPNQQYIINTSNPNKYSIKTGVDVNEFTSWKTDVFEFSNKDIGAVFKLLSRWYTIDSIDFKKLNEDTFTGVFKRSRSLRNVLDQLEMVSNYKFKIESNHIIVY